MRRSRAIGRATIAALVPIAGRAIRRWLAALALLAIPLVALALDQRTFASPEAAVDAMARALEADDDAALLSIFGADHRQVVSSGDRAYDTAQRAAAASAISAYRALDERGPDRRVLLMGAQAWPFAIPLVRTEGAWRFATEQGVEELMNRRIGANERNAIRVLRSYVDAQRQYASADRDGDGVLEYARRLVSSPGKRDGLYWPARGTETPSPWAALIAAEAPYLAGHAGGTPYRGYHFKVLAAQGVHAAGGAYGYAINGRMVAGFTLVAYPSDFGRSGVMTFIVNQNGKVFQRSLGAQTTPNAKKMTRFDPGPGWVEVAP